MVKIKNRNAVVVGQAEPLMEFSYKDGTDIADDVKRTLLLETLSEGEKKALYILDILFDVQVRKNRGEETLFIFDDIADSFDYKNKYAIIQYLTDISRDPHFKMILLTHNFDFYRTVCSRFVGHNGSFLATRNEMGVITIEKPDGIQNIFVNVWKKEFFKDIRRRIASISFMRNLIEYTKSTTDPDYSTLTSLVHIKPNTRQITQKQVDEIYSRLFGSSGNAWQFPDSIVIDDIALRANIPETSLVPLINEQGEKEKGRNEREFSWCCSFSWGFGCRGTERRRAKRAAAQCSDSQSGRRFGAGFAAGSRSSCQTEAADLHS
jgi:energy-coupling factor transporter ATP-binding protein EcfA2